MRIYRGSSETEALFTTKWFLKPIDNLIIFTTTYDIIFNLITTTANNVTSGLVMSAALTETGFLSNYLHVSKTPMPTLSASQDNVVPIIAAIVGVALVVLGTAIIAVVIALIIIRRKKSKHSTSSYTVDEKVELDNFDNPIYTTGKNDSIKKFKLFLSKQIPLPLTCLIQIMLVSP